MISALMVISLLLGGTTQASAAPGKNPVVADSASAMPANPTDGTKVPHYFGPYPNWANSPLTLPNATVEIQGGQVESWAAEVAREHGFTDASHQVEVFGVCGTCAAATERG